MDGEPGLFGSRISRHFGFQRSSTLNVRSEARISVALTHLHSDAPGSEPSPTPEPEAAFSIMVQLAPLPWHDMRLGPKPYFSGAVPAGAVCVVDLEDRPASRLSGLFDAVQFYVPRRTLDDLCVEDGVEHIGRLSRPRAEPDPTAFALTMLLLPHLHGTAPGSTLFVEHATTAFLAHAIRSYGGSQIRTPVSRGGLSAWQERRAKELLRASITQGVSIVELARECRLSPRHFANAFRQSVGQPPHRYLTALRIVEAKRLLLTSDLSLAEIATACGFGSQSHLSRAFVAGVGCSPGAWRRSCKG